MINQLSVFFIKKLYSLKDISPYYGLRYSLYSFKDLIFSAILAGASPKTSPLNLNS